MQFAGDNVLGQLQKLMLALGTWRAEREFDKVYGHRPTASAEESSGLLEVDEPRKGL